MESQIELNNERKELLDTFKRAAPDFMTVEYAAVDEAYKDGALRSRVKRLMALAIALRAGCTNCILAQTQRALEAGATKDEILETLFVVISMSGTTGIAESLRVIKFLDELGRL
jgi:AhpD family alkylhydroperoxidase